MSTNKKSKGTWLLTGLTTVALLGAIGSASRVQSAPPPPPADFRAQVAVVDFKRLIQAHRDFKNLETLDREIALLQQRLQEGPSTSSADMQDAYNKLTLEQKRLKKEYDSDVDQAKADLEGKSAAMQRELEGLANQMSGEMKTLAGQLGKQPLPAPTGKSVDNVRKDLSHQLAVYFDDLKLVRERALSARRLELQRQVEIKLSGEKARLDRELQAYSDQLVHDDQQKIVNLDLERIRAATEEDRQKVDAEKNAIIAAENAKKDARRHELEGQFNALKDAEMAGIDSKVKTYQTKIDADARVQLDKEKQRLLAQYGQSVMPLEKQEISSERKVLTQQLQEKQAQLRARFEARKAALEGELAAQQEQVKARLEARAKEIGKHLKAMQAKLMKGIAKKQTDLEKADKEKIAALKKDLEETKAQRDRLHDTIEAELKQKVKELAQRENIPVVLGYYVVNTNCLDLTDKALKVVGQ